MHISFRAGSFWHNFMLLSFLVSIFLSVIPTMPVQAANHSIQTGYYMGTGAARSITGVGFQPKLVIIKSSNGATNGVFKSSAMPADTIAYLSATVDTTSTAITLNSDGFTLSGLSAINTVNSHYIWTAFAGSDCTVTGTMCVGTYTGDGAATKTITTGFQPAIVIDKRSTAVGAHFRTASMEANRAEYFTSTAADTTGGLIQSFSSNGFTVGATDNVTAGVYYYIAYKTTAGLISEGAYTGDGTDNRSITGVGFKPVLLLVKNSTSATVNNRRALMSNTQNYGDSASYTGDAAVSASNFIQELQSDGFQVGSGANTNETAMTNYWLALGGTEAQPAASGSFTMSQGSYTGNGSSQSIAGVGFMADLIIVKDTATNSMVFRTGMMHGDLTAYFAVGSANFTRGITAVTGTGFSVGTSTTTNASGGTYYWQAFGNAYDPETGSGATDFAIGTYMGTAIDNKLITGIPYQLDYLVIKSASITAAAQRSSGQVGDTSSFFAATADAANTIQAINATSFEIGTNVVNTSGIPNNWFGFKTGTNFSVGNYTGNGVVDRAVTTTAANQPSLVWVKQSTAVAGVSRPFALSGDSTQYFAATANSTGRIKVLTGTGFTLGSATEVNTNAGAYRYVAWRSPPTGTLGADIVTAVGTSVPVPTFAMNTVGFPYDCSVSSGYLGADDQRVRVSNLSGTSAWSLSIAATGGASAAWVNGGNTQGYDYNDSSGCSDGADTDAAGGKLQILPSNGSLAPQVGCSSNNITLGSTETFNEGVVDSITLLSAGNGAALGCYWDLTNVELRQTLPANQATDDYTIDLTLTATAS